MPKLTIPAAAMPVVKVLRRDVPRPRTLPEAIYPKCRGLRWDMSCPMGLHKASSHRTPYRPESFAAGECSAKAVKAFADWWDRQAEAKAAVDAVWPK